jgi:hypothetical protein
MNPGSVCRHLKIAGRVTIRDSFTSPDSNPEIATLPRGLSVFDFGAAFSIPDKRSCGIEVLEGAYLPLRNPENPRN